MDLLTMKYPGKAQDIEFNRANGYTDDEIEAEYQARFQVNLFNGYQEHEIEAAYGITPESKKAWREASRNAGYEALANAFDLTKKQVVDTHVLANGLGINPSTFLADRQLYEKARKMLDASEETKPLVDPPRSMRDAARAVMTGERNQYAEQALTFSDNMLYPTARLLSSFERMGYGVLAIPYQVTATAGNLLQDLGIVDKGNSVVKEWNDYAEYLKHPEKHGIISPWVAGKQERRRAESYTQSFMAGLFSDIGDAVIDFMGLAMSMNAVNAVTAGSLSPLAGASTLGNIYKTAKMQGTMGFLTTPGDMEERLQAGAYRVAYNLTPYVANAFTSGYRAVATDFLLNSFLTMPTYLSAFKNSRNPEEFLSMAIPQAVIDLGMAWNTRGSPDTHRRAVINRQVDEFAKAAGIPKEDARFFVENDWARADEVMGRNFWEGTSPEMIREGDVKYDRYTGEKYEVTSVRPGSVFARLVGTGREEAVATRVGEIQRIFSDKLSGVLDDDTQIADAAKLYAVAAMHAEQVGAVKDALADAKAVTFERSEDGRVVTFSQNAGEGAKTAPLKDLGRAKIMLSRGSRTPEEIFRLTGWEKGFDGEWRFTIDDTKATFQPGLLSRGNVVDGLRDKLSKNVSVRLGDVLNHPALFAAYPHLANMNIYLTEGKYGSKIAGKWSDDLPGIHIGTMASFDDGHNRQKTDFEFMSALTHEIQHSIQNSERGFQHGFGMEGIRARIGIVQDALYKAHEAGDKDAENRYLFELWRLGVPEKEIGLEPSVKVLYDAYRRTAGEAEARAAQLRLTYTEEQLRNESPNETLRKMLVEEGLHKEGDSVLDTLLFLPRDPGDPDIAWSIPESAFHRGETRYQGDETAPRGGYTVADDVNRTITLFSKADASTIIHEYLGHHLIERYLEAESRGTLTDEAKADIDLLRKWAGSEDGKLTDEQKETIATAWEKYLMEGKTPHTELAGVFERFKQKLLEVYSVIRGKIDGVELSDDVRRTFDRMLDVKEPGDAPKESRETILEFGKDYLLNEPPKPSAIRALDFPLKHVVDIGGEVRAIGDDFKARKGRLLKTQTKDGKNKTILLQEVLKDSSLTPEDRAEVRQLMRDPVDMPLTIDDVRRLPITDAAVRLGFAGVKVAPIDYEDVPLAKILRSKDQAVKGPALELVKELAKNADMGEDIAWEQRSSNMWILSEYDLKVRSTATQGMRNMMNDAVRENPDLKDALSSADLKSLNLVSLGEMTLGRIRELNAILSENAEKGRAILRERRAAEQERIDSDAMKLRGTLKAELGDGKPVLRKGDLPSAKKNRGALQGAKNLYKMSLTPSRLFDLLDGYKNFKGFWSKLFYGETNKREDEAKYHMQNRRGYVMKVLRDSNLTTKSLADMRTVGTGDDEVTLTRSEAIGVYAHSLVPHQKKGIIDLNGLSERQIDLIVSSLSDGEKAVAHAIIKDFADNFDRIDQAFIRHANVGMDYVPNYTPIYWLFRTGASGSFIDAEKENQLQMVQAANHLKRQYARNGFTKTRVEEYPENMRGAIDLNLFSVWNRALQVHEHFAAYADHIRHLRRVLDWRGADNISNLEHLTNEYGTPMREIIESYVNRIADPTFYKADVATNTLNRWIKGLRQNVAVAYLSYNLLTMAKQLPSLAFYAGEAGPHQLLASLGRALIPGEFSKMRKLTETLDPQINERGLDRSIEELRLEWEGKDTIRGRIARFGMKGITAMDRIAVTIGWNAVYESYMAKGASQEEAMQKAQFVTLQTQPASHPKDIPHLYATNNEILNLFLQFTNQVNKVWNITTHDLYTQAKNGDYSTPLVSVVALTLSAAMIHALSGGWNEDETFGDFLSQAAGAQLGNSLPVFGRDIVGYFQGYRGGELATSKAARNIFKGFEDALKGEVTEQTAWRLWEAMSVMWLGMPVVGPRRMAQFGETGDPAKLLGLGKTKKKPTFNF
jgi:hypothetical protein